MGSRTYRGERHCQRSLPLTGDGLAREFSLRQEPGLCHPGRVTRYRNAFLGYSELPRPVDVGAVLDSHNIDSAPLVVDTVDHSVVATVGTVQPLQAEL